MPASFSTNSLRITGMSLAALCVLLGGHAWAATPVDNASAASNGLAHSVTSADTLVSICSQYRLSATQCKEFASANQLAEGRLPAAGNTVWIPLSAFASKPEQVRLVQTVGDVKLNGQPVKAGVRLDENASLATGEGSSAVVEMADGSRVKIMPKSLADIVQSRSYSAPENSASGKLIDWFAAKMRLTQGAVEALVNKIAPRTQPLQVETPTSLIGVRGTEFRVAAADATVRADRAEVLSGTVSNINTWKNSWISLGQGQGAVVDPNVAEIKAVALLNAPAMPAPGQVVRRPNAVWSFPAVAGAQTYRVIAANDAKYENITYSEKLTGTSADLSSLPNGTLYMRVRGVDALGLEGLSGDTAIVLKQPAWMLRNVSIGAVHGRPTLVWNGLAYGNAEPIPGASTVNAELARQPDFSDATRFDTTSASSLPLPYLVHGTYYLRLGVQNTTLNNDEQLTYRFTIPPGFSESTANVLLEAV